MNLGGDEKQLDTATDQPVNACTILAIQLFATFSHCINVYSYSLPFSRNTGIHSFSAMNVDTLNSIKPRTLEIFFVISYNMYVTGACNRMRNSGWSLPMSLHSRGVIGEVIEALQRCERVSCIIRNFITTIASVHLTDCCNFQQGSQFYNMCDRYF